VLLGAMALAPALPPAVTPAKAGAHPEILRHADPSRFPTRGRWAPAFAGVTSSVLGMLR